MGKLHKESHRIHILQIHISTYTINQFFVSMIILVFPVTLFHLSGVVSARSVNLQHKQVRSIISIVVGSVRSRFNQLYLLELKSKGNTLVQLLDMGYN